MSTVIPTFLKHSRCLLCTRTSVSYYLDQPSLARTVSPTPDSIKIWASTWVASLIVNPSFSGSLHSRQIPCFVMIQVSNQSIPCDRSYLQIFCPARADHLSKRFGCSVHDRREQASHCTVQRVSISLPTPTTKDPFLMVCCRL